MGIKELAAKVAAAHPELTTNKAAAVLRTVFEAVKQELATSGDGTVKYPALGHFVVSTKPAKGDEGAAADGDSKRKIHLKLAKDKPEAAGKAAQKTAKRAGAVQQREAKRAEKKAERATGKAARKAAKPAKPAPKA